MNKPIIKFVADFGPLLIFFIIYFNNENDLKLAIPPFIIATLIALIVIYFLEKRIPMVPLISGILITFFGGLTLYFDNKIFFYMKPTIINLLFAVRLICDRFNFPLFFSEAIVSVTQLFWIPLAGIVEPDKSNTVMKKFNAKLKLLVKKLKKQGHALYDSHDARKVEVKEWKYL